VKTTARSFLRRALLGLCALTVLFLAVVAVSGCQSFGARATGSRRARMEASPHFADGHFVNPQPLQNSWSGALSGMLHVSPYASPAQPPPIRDAKQTLARPPQTGLRVTWLGHSTTLVELDGKRVLTDPVFSERVSPVGFLGPERWHAPPIALADLPHVDAVVISHDHYDHLDHGTIAAMKDWDTTFVVPLGVGAHLAAWGVPEKRIVELDWWGRAWIAGNLEIIALPARHASGRVLFDDDAKLWAGYALLGPRHRVYYSGDTGLFPALRDIGKRLGPFDLTMIEVGQYNQAWPDWHLGPEQAVRAHQLVQGRVLLPVHWGTFQLAYHSWTEPIERALAAGAAAKATVLAPRPGQSVEPEAPPAFERWWPAVPGKTFADDPIVATQMD
jgi:L-ascorbate metabolism protein UlaG (beta-lactamase superfamily)